MGYNYYTIPDPVRGPVTIPSVKDAKSVNLIPSDVYAAANWEHRLTDAWVAPEYVGASFKGWRWNRGVTDPNAPDHFFYVALARKEDGSLDLLDLRDPAAMSDSTWRYYGTGVAQFYQSHPGTYGLIPKLAFKAVPKAEALRMNFGADLTGRPVKLTEPAVDYPLGIFLPDETGPCRIAWFDNAWHCGNSSDYSDKGILDPALSFQARCTWRSDYAVRYDVGTGVCSAFRYIV